MGEHHLKRAVFLDRDGVLNDVTVRGGKPYSPRTFDAFLLRAEAAPQLTRLKEAGWLLIVITNQPDIARGKMPRDELDKMTRALRDTLPVDDVLICPHDDSDDCPCRKPRPGLLIQAVEKYGIDLPSAVMVGDSWKDAGAARSAGCRSVIIDASYNRGVECDVRVASLRECADLILAGNLPAANHKRSQTTDGHFR